MSALNGCITIDYKSMMELEAHWLCHEDEKPFFWWMKLMLENGIHKYIVFKYMSIHAYNCDNWEWQGKETLSWNRCMTGHLDELEHYQGLSSISK